MQYAPFNKVTFPTIRLQTPEELLNHAGILVLSAIDDIGKDLDCLGYVVRERRASKAIISSGCVFSKVLI